MYSTKLLEHFQHSRYAGKVPEANVYVTVENPVCGDILELQGIVLNGIIRSIRFRAKGCVPAMACGSAVCQLSDGLRIAEAQNITSEQLLREVDGVPHASMHAVQLALDALKKLLQTQ